MNSDGVPREDRPGDREKADFDPQAALDVADTAEYRARRARYPHTALVYAMWGSAWLLGYGTIYGSAHGWLPLNHAQALIAFSIILGAALLVSMLLGIAAGSGIRGNSAFQGAVYGWSWFLGMGLLAVLAARIGSVIDHPPTVGLIINGVAVLIVGLIFMLGGALWRDAPMVALGIWFLLVDAVALLMGPDAYLKIFMTLGVAGFYVGAIIEGLRDRRAARAARGA